MFLMPKQEKTLLNQKQKKILFERQMENILMDDLIGKRKEKKLLSNILRNKKKNPLTKITIPQMKA